MKFGERLCQLRVIQWAEYYLDYDKLKAILSSNEPPKNSDLSIASSAFEQLLTLELSKVDNFFLSLEKSLSFEFHNALGHMSAADHDRVSKFVDMIEELRSFILVNTIAVIKIVKKRNKVLRVLHNPIDVQSLLLRQQFYRAEIFTSILHNTDVVLAHHRVAFQQSDLTEDIKRMRRNLASSSKHLSLLKSKKDEDDDEESKEDVHSLLPHHTFTTPAPAADLADKLDSTVGDYLNTKLGSNHELKEIVHHRVGTFPPHLQKELQEHAQSDKFNRKQLACALASKSLVLLLAVTVFQIILSSLDSTSQFNSSTSSSASSNDGSLWAKIIAASNSPSHNQNGHIVGSLPWNEVDIKDLNDHLTEDDVKHLDQICAPTTTYQVCRSRPGFGSGLAFDRFTTHRLLTHTDRGPNQDCEELSVLADTVPQYVGAKGKAGKSFMVPRFAPSFTFFDVRGNKVDGVRYHGLTKWDGSPVSGISNDKNGDTPWPTDCTGDQLSFTIVFISSVFCLFVH
jgi:hypothetical protein